MKQIANQIAALRQNYNELGEDLILLESVVTALQTGYEFPEEYIVSSLERVVAYIGQHAEEVQNLSNCLQKIALQSCSKE